MDNLSCRTARPKIFNLLQPAMYLPYFREQFPPLNSFRTFIYCDQYIRPNSKKNSFRGNYSRKYGMYLQNDKDRVSNWLCWLLYHMRIPITGRSHELLQLRMGCFTGRKKSHFILHVPCFRLFSPSPVATDKTVGTGWDWIALLQILAGIEGKPYNLNGVKPRPCIFFRSTKTPAFRTFNQSKL